MGQAGGPAEVRREDVGIQQEAHSGSPRVEGRWRSRSIASRIRSSSSVQCSAIMPAAVSVPPGCHPGGGPGNRFLGRITLTWTSTSCPSTTPGLHRARWSCRGLSRAVSSSSLLLVLAVRYDSTPLPLRPCFFSATTLCIDPVVISALACGWGVAGRWREQGTEIGSERSVAGGAWPRESENPCWLLQLFAPT